MRALPYGFMLAAAFILGAVLSRGNLLLPVAMYLTGTVVVATLLAEDRRVAAAGALLLAALALGCARAAADDPFPKPDPELETASSFAGRVIDLPRHYPSGSFSRLQLSDPAPAVVWGELPAYPEVKQGDELSILGSFRGFDEAPSRGFAAQRGTAGVLAAERVSVLDNRATLPQRWRNRISDEVKARLRTRVPEPAGAFATGIVLGDDGAMTGATRHAFRVGGLSHMTAVSGIHVGIVAGALLFLSQIGLIHRWWLMGASIPMIWAFAYLVGMRPSVTRASLMLTLFLIAQFLGRPRDTLNAVGLAAALMVLVSPSVLYDIGFQLSVAATTGIALGLLLIGDRSRWHVVWVVPLAAEVATTPLILHHFGYYSLASPIANIIAAPFLAVAMAASLLTVLLSFPSALVADALAIGVWVPSMAVVMIADAAATVPGVTGETRPLTATGVWVFYAVLSGLLAVLYVLLRPRVPEAEGDVELVYRV